MILDTYTKQPTDVRDYVLNYTDWAPVTPSSVVVTVDDAALVIDSSNIVSPYIVVRCSGGVVSTKYKVTVTTTMSDTQIKQDEFYVKVKEY